jgi:hypothetical protein
MNNSTPQIEILDNLIKDLIGPSKGVKEELSIPPFSKYLTGYIAPPDFQEFDLNILLQAKEFLYEDEEETSDEDLIWDQIARINPGKPPSSIGLVFTVKDPGEDIKLDLAISGAIYIPNKQENKKNFSWKRKPICKVLSLTVPHNSSIKPQVLKFELETPSDEKFLIEIPLKVTTRKTKEGIDVIVTLYNTTKLDNNGDLQFLRQIQASFYQPQIRINLRNTKLYLENGSPKIKGLNCAAVYKEIDIQNKYKEEIKEGKLPEVLDWIDGKYCLDKPQYERFLAPDIRTEFLPIYERIFPDFEIKTSEDIFSAEALAENPELEKLTEFFVKNYEKWIKESSFLQENFKKDHYRIQKRLKDAIDLLQKDKEVKLAFSFANKVMDLQYRWKTGKPLIWRSFQLGYLLLVLKSLADPSDSYREYCDLLYVPTGGGKTEAYLAVIAFYLALRRLKEGKKGYGTGVISRYTLRLLSVQQFQRAAGVITAAEYLRAIKWQPRWFKNSEERITNLWGSERFSIGLWVGRNITPNNYNTALNILRNPEEARKKKEPFPTIQTVCPACGSILALPPDTPEQEQAGAKGIPWDSAKSFYIPVIAKKECLEVLENFNSKNIKFHNISNIDLYSCLGILEVKFNKTTLNFSDIKNLFYQEFVAGKKLIECFDPISINPAFPGYLLTFFGRKQKLLVHCPNPNCPLNNLKEEYRFGYEKEDNYPSVLRAGITYTNLKQYLNNNALIYRFINIDRKIIQKYLNTKILIPVLTVDEEIYKNPPSLLIATVDKFARLPFKEDIEALFGRLNFYNTRNLEYECKFKEDNKQEKDYFFEPPGLILQDELHLISGPLGSLAGLYETVVDALCSEVDKPSPLSQSPEDEFSKDLLKKYPKYIASTATISGADNQIQALFNRKAFIFPGPPNNKGENYFSSVNKNRKLLFSEGGGRIYIGVLPIGRSFLTSQVRIYSSLLAAKYKKLTDSEKEYYGSIVGYYNALKELAGGRRILDDDVIDRLQKDYGLKNLSYLNITELSGRLPSEILPVYLKRLENAASYKEKPDILLTTSMFGTGVDIPYLSVMVVNGQPKLTSDYIQATGRVGRKKIGVIVTLYKPSRPRDISFFEHFMTYHSGLEQHVEVPSVFPFSERVMHKASGPVAVAYLRLSKRVHCEWRDNKNGPQFITDRRANQDIEKIVKILKIRAYNQPDFLKLDDINKIEDILLYKRENSFSVWMDYYRNNNNGNLRYVEYTLFHRPEKDVVLGDIIHEKAGKLCIFRRVPQSLRNVEEEISYIFIDRYGG